MNKLQMCEQLRKALQMLAQSLTEEQAMEVATLYPAYKVGVAYKEGEFFTYGVNGVGDPQLYKVVQNHTSQEDWNPDKTQSLYVAIGLNSSGYPIWSRPTGAHDAYETGEIVEFEGRLYKSLINGNTYSPTEYPAGWETYEE